MSLYYTNTRINNCILKKKLNASSLDLVSIPQSEGQREKNVKMFRWGHTVGCKYKTSSWHLSGFPDGSNIGSTVKYRGETLRHAVSMVITYSKSMDQPGKVANPARGQPNRENEYFPVRVRA